MKPQKIADKAFKKIAKKYKIERACPSESWETALYWELGEGVNYETVREVVLEAISQTQKALEPKGDLVIDLDTGTVLGTNLVTITEPEDQADLEEILSNDTNAIAYGQEHGKRIFP